MKNDFKIALMLSFMISMLFLTGCQGNFVARKKLSQYDFPEIEASWIREGKPIEFEGELWYPQRNIEIFLDEEVYPVAQQEGVKVFVDKVDIRPYSRLYTKFGRNKFRSFKKKRHD